MAELTTSSDTRTDRVLTVLNPSEWAPPPEFLSFSLLKEVESCALRAALRRAKYVGLWDKWGYPPKLNEARIAGSIVHETVVKIAAYLRSKGLESVHDEGSFSALKELGGYSRMIADTLAEMLARLQDNPRCHNPDRLKQSLVVRLPEMREKTQIMLSRLRWKSHASGTPVSQETRSQGPLSAGSHFEILLTARSLKWKGVADLIEVYGSDVSIVDFKTGSRSESHEEQLEIYALLWANDEDLNPSGSLATGLCLSYPNGPVAVTPPDNTSLQELKKGLLKRSRSAIAALASTTPQANISADTCPLCDVRHLCSEYWKQTSRNKIGPPKNSNFEDIEFQLEKRLGELTWVGHCAVATGLIPASELLVRVSAEHRALASTLKPGVIVRALDANVTKGEEARLPIVSLLGLTELFLVDSNNA
jgi:hypothetical protein